jgi:hypothetical protein
MVQRILAAVVATLMFTGPALAIEDAVPGTPERRSPKVTAIQERSGDEMPYVFDLLIARPMVLISMPFRSLAMALAAPKGRVKEQVVNPALVIADRPGFHPDRP